MLKILTAFRRAESGIAAVEFALVAPIMIMMFFATVEVCNALNAHQKVTSVASTAADLVAQATQVSQSDLGDVFAASASIMTPFPDNAKIIVTSLAGTGTKNLGKVVWSKGSTGSDGTVTPAHSVGSNISIGTATADPSASADVDGLLPANCDSANECTVIFVEVSYTYTSPYGKFIVGAPEHDRHILYQAAPRDFGRLHRLRKLKLQPRLRGRINPSCATEATSVPSRV